MRSWRWKAPSAASASPPWQIDENGKPFDVLPKLFELLGDSPWTVYRFLVQRHADLDGASAQDYLRRGRADQVVETAESVARGAYSHSMVPGGFDVTS